MKKLILKYLEWKTGRLSNKYDRLQTKLHKCYIRLGEAEKRM